MVLFWLCKVRQKSDQYYKERIANPNQPLRHVCRCDMWAKCVKIYQKTVICNVKKGDVFDNRFKLIFDSKY